MRAAVVLPLIPGGCMMATWERNLASGPVGVVVVVCSFPTFSPIRAATPEAKDVRCSIKDRRKYLQEKL